MRSNPVHSTGQRRPCALGMGAELKCLTQGLEDPLGFWIAIGLLLIGITMSAGFAR